MHRSEIPCKETKFWGVPCPKPDLKPEWRQKKGTNVRKKLIAKKEKEIKDNCALTVGDYRHPNEKQGYLFVNDQERLGAKRTSFLTNVNISQPRIGQKFFHQGFQPELEKVTHGLPYCYENGVAQCLGEWREQTPSLNPRHAERDHIKINKNCKILGFKNEDEFKVYRDNVNIRLTAKEITGKRDQTIYYPKDMTFGMPSEEHECLYDILANKEQAEWMKERKDLDRKLCLKELAKIRKLVSHEPTRACELRSTHNHLIVHPPAPSPRPLTRLRRRSKPKISTHWNVEEALKLLYDHPEVEYRMKHFGLPAKSNLYYNEVNDPESLDRTIRMADEKPTSSLATRSAGGDCKAGCVQCGSLQCCCQANESASEKSKSPDNLATEVLGNKKHVVFSDVVQKSN